MYKEETEYVRSMSESDLFDLANNLIAEIPHDPVFPKRPHINYCIIRWLGYLIEGGDLAPHCYYLIHSEAKGLGHKPKKPSVT